MSVKVSVVVTTFNEEKTIIPLLDSLQNQSLHPTEVVIVDAGSTDETVSTIEEFVSKNSQLQISIVHYPNSNRSQARNKGIQLAESPILAVTDAGCIPKKQWLEKLITPFEDKNTEVVAGFYDPDVRNTFQNIAANVTSTREWNFDAETYLPSSRSIAFTKGIWQRVEGYPEQLNYCEDLVFAEKLKKEAKGWKIVQDAQVLWPQPKTLSELRDKVFHYATGDLEAKYERHTTKINSALWRIIILLCVAFPLMFSQNLYLRLSGIALFGLYIFGSLWKHRKVITSPFSIVFIPFVQITVDMALIQALIFHRLNQQES